jgi:hypothetical protein
MPPISCIAFVFQELPSCLVHSSFIISFQNDMASNIDSGDSGDEDSWFPPNKSSKLSISPLPEPHPDIEKSLCPLEPLESVLHTSSAPSLCTVSSETASCDKYGPKDEPHAYDMEVYSPTDVSWGGPESINDKRAHIQRRISTAKEDLSEIFEKMQKIDNPSQLDVIIRNLRKSQEKLRFATNFCSQRYSIMPYKKPERSSQKW